MTDSKRVLFIIDSLARGGAETLLVSTLTSLRKHDFVLVALRSDNDFTTEGIQIDYVLNFNNKWDVFSAVRKFKKILKEEKVSLVHTHLFWSTLIGRLACPKGIPMVTTIHCPISNSVEYQNPIYKLIDSISFHLKKTALIGVSNYVLEDYKKQLQLPSGITQFVLYNCVDNSFFENKKKSILKNKIVYTQPLKVVAVGSLKEAKNFGLLIEALKHITYPVHLDIIGEGPLRVSLENKINAHLLPVNLLGKRNNLAKLLPDYDLFVLPSTYEGFGIAVAEAIAVGLPTLLSDISVFKEITNYNSVFFESGNIDDFLRKFEFVLNEPDKVEELAERAHSHIYGIARNDDYILKLEDIYRKLIDQ